MSAVWTEVRRSVPAEHVTGVPDHATVYAAWTDAHDRTVTVYKHACGWTVVEHAGETATVRDEYPTEGREAALFSARRIREHGGMPA